LSGTNLLRLLAIVSFDVDPFVAAVEGPSYISICFRTYSFDFWADSLIFGMISLRFRATATCGCRSRSTITWIEKCWYRRHLTDYRIINCLQ
jgi:hypothetical protein